MAPSRSRLAAVAALLAAAALVVGCGRGETGGSGSAPVTVDDSPATGTVTLWAPDGDAKKLDAVLSGFKQQNPGLDLQITLVPSDEYNTKLQTAIAAGTTPDIAFLYTEAQTQFLATEAFTPVPDGLVDPSSFFPGSWAAGEIDGTAHSVPWYAYTRLLVYRKDFAEAGGATVPTTWGETVPFFQALQRGGAVHGLGADVGWDTYSGQSLATFAHQAGATLLSADGLSWKIDDPAVVTAAEFNASFFTSGVASPDTPQFLDSQPYLVSGQTGSMISGPWVLTELDTAAKQPGWVQAHIATAVLPAGPDNGSGQLAGGSWGVTATSSNPTASWKVVRAMAQQDIQVAQYRAAGSMPAVVAAWDDPSISGQPLLAPFLEQLKNVRPTPAVSTWNEVSTLLGKAMESVARGRQTAADALAEVQKQADGIGTD